MQLFCGRNLGRNYGVSIPRSVPVAYDHDKPNRIPLQSVIVDLSGRSFLMDASQILCRRSVSV